MTLLRRPMHCLNCCRMVAPAHECACGRDAAVPMMRPRARSLIIGHLRLVAGDTDLGASLAHRFPGPLSHVPETDESAIWIGRGETAATTVWIWQSRLAELPGPYEPAGCSDQQAMRLRALHATNVLLIDLPPESLAEQAAFRGFLADEPEHLQRICASDVVDWLCAWLEQMRLRLSEIILVGDAAQLGQDADRQLSRYAPRVSYQSDPAAAVVETIERLDRTAPRDARVSPPPQLRNHVNVADLGGVAGRELLSQLHAASAWQTSWLPGAPVPSLVRFPSHDRGVGDITGRQSRFVGSCPSEASLHWGVIHRRRRTPPAPRDEIPRWTVRVRAGLGWYRHVYFESTWVQGRWRLAAPAVTLVGVGSDAEAGRRQLDARLEADDAWLQQPMILVRHRYTAALLWRAVEAMFPRADAFEIEDSHYEPWCRPAVLLRPALRALALARGLVRS